MGGRDSGAEQQSALLAQQQKELADKEAMEMEALKADQKKKRKEFVTRSKTMQGGGRTGLMYGQNYQGV